MGIRRCLDCGNPTTRTRCTTCQRTYRTRYNRAWQRLSETTRRNQPWCTWCGTSTDLVADHLIPGQPERGVRTLCRPCNTRRRNGQPEPPARGPRDLQR